MSDRLQDVASGRTKVLGGGNWLKGRSNRRQYWVLVGPVIVVQSVLGLVGAASAGRVLSVIITLAAIRRFHDLGRSGWLIVGVNVGAPVLGFAAKAILPSEGSLIGPCAYLIAIAILGAIPGQAGENQFGPGMDPKRSSIVETFS
jgi:uncharacterized membrane protein YhaH (DUF805 family)